MAARAGVAQLARASPCHGEGRGFESLHSLQEIFNFVLMKLSYIAAVIGSVALLAGCNTAPNPIAPDTTETQTQNQQEESTSQNVTASIEVTEPTDDVNAMMEEGTEAETTTDETPKERVSAKVAMNETIYKALNASERESMHGSEPYLLFFHATLCPTCRKMDGDINAQLASFPEGTKILKADYDTEDALKDEYNVRVQSTVVVLDANGEVVWQGTDPAIEDFKGYIEDSLS